MTTKDFQQRAPLMKTVKSWFLQILQLLPLIHQVGSDFVKHMFRIHIEKGGKVLVWNQVKSRMEACYSKLISVTILKALF